MGGLEGGGACRVFMCGCVGGGAGGQCKAGACVQVGGGANEHAKACMQGPKLAQPLSTFESVG